MSKNGLDVREDFQDDTQHNHHERMKICKIPLQIEKQLLIKVRQPLASGTAWGDVYFPAGIAKQMPRVRFLSHRALEVEVAGAPLAGVHLTFMSSCKI